MITPVGMLPCLSPWPPNHIGYPYLFKVPAKEPRVNALLERAEERMMKGQYGSALADLEKALHLVPHYYQIHFLRGKLFQLMKRDNGITEYEKALEWHPSPERLKKSCGEIVLGTSAKNKVPVVDLYTTFRDHLLGPEKRFVDACHPSPLGHNLIADSLSLPILRILGAEIELGI